MKRTVNRMHLRRGTHRPPAARRTLGFALCAGLLVVAGCNSTSATEEGPGPGSDRDQRATSSAQPDPVSLSARPADGTTDVEPGDTVTVESDNGTLSEVELVGKDGTVVDGELNQQETRWKASQKLGFGKSYTLTATGVGASGNTKTTSSTFTTAQPSGTVGVRTNFADGQTVGVGMPLIFRFTRPVTDRAAVEEALTIEPEPDTAGDFRWFSDDRVIWRPKEYWESGTTVRVDAAIYGQDLGNGVFGEQDKSFELNIGDKVVAVADGSTHTMNVQVNGSTARTYDIAMGKQGHETPKGTYTVMSDHTNYVMDSSSYGVPVDSAQGYKLTVDYATRLSWSGIFFHSAPWSVGDQGHRNVSHGCINMQTAQAKWLMDNTKPGDLFTVRNSGGESLRATDGWSVWQMSWQQWESTDA